VISVVAVTTLLGEPDGTDACSMRPHDIMLMTVTDMNHGTGLTARVFKSVIKKCWFWLGGTHILGLEGEIKKLTQGCFGDIGIAVGQCT
jgi:hypothetical protein